MAIEISDASLIWEADIDESKLKLKLASIQKLLADAGNKNFTFDQTLGDTATKAAKNIKPLKDAIDQAGASVTTTTKNIKEQTKALLDEDAAMIKLAKSTKYQKEQQDALNVSATNVGAVKSSAAAAGKTFSSSELLGAESAKMKLSVADLRASIAETVAAFEPLAGITALYVEQLTGLEIQQRNVRQQQNELNAAFRAGAIGEGEFITLTEQLAGAQTQIAEQMAIANAEHKKFQQNMAAETSEGIVLREALAALESQYLQLAIAEGEVAAKSKLGPNITALKSQIAGFTPIVEEVKAGVTSAVTQVGTFATRALGYVRQIAYILPGIGVAGILGFASESIINFFKNLVGAATETLSKIKLIEDAAKKVADANLSQLASIRTYQVELRNANLSEQQRIDIYNKLIAIDPQIVKGLDSKTFSYSQLAARVDDYARALRKQYALETNAEAIKASLAQEAELQKKIVELGKQQADQQQKSADLIKAGAVENSRAAFIQSQLAQSSKSQVVEYANKLDEQKKITDDLINDSAKLQRQRTQDHVRNLADIEADIAAQKKLQETATNKAEFDAIQKRIDALQKEKEAITGKDEKKISGESKYQSLLDKRQKFLEQIANAERDANQTGFTKKASEIDNINQKYDKQIQQLKDLNSQFARYNASTKGKDVQLFGQNEIDRLNAARALELLNFKYKDDLANYVDSLEAKRDAFEKFQKIAEDGTAEQVELAKKQYGEDAANYRTYLDYLKSQRDKLLPALFGTGGNTGDLLKLNKLNDLIKAEQPKQDAKDREDNQKNLDALLQQLNSYYVKKQQIDNKYAKLTKTLNDNASSISPEELRRRQETLEKQRNEELDAVGQQYLEQDAVVKHYYDHKEELSSKATQAVIDRLKKERDGVDKTSEAYRILTNAIAAAQGDKKTKQGEELVKGLRETASVIGSIFSNLTIDINKNLKITGQQIQQVFNDIATIFDKNSSKSSQVGSIIGLITNIITTARDALLTEKDLLTGLEPSQDAFNAITNQITAQNAALEHQQELINGLYGKDRIDALIKLQDDLQNKQKATFIQLKQLQLDVIKSQQQVYVDPLFHTSVSSTGINSLAQAFLYGGQAKTKVKVELETIDTSKFSTIEDFINLLNEIQANGGKLNGKVVVEDDIKALQTLIDNYNDLQQKSAQLKAQLQELFTGTTSDQIADAIIEGLKAGKSATKDFADNFEDLMRQAILNSIKIQTLEKPLQAFYDTFAQFAASNGALTPAEIQQLKDTYNTIIQNASDQFKALQQITNIDLSASSSDQNTLKGAIKGITEEQADLLAGQFGAVRLTLIDNLKTLQQVFTTLQSIERNTASIDVRMEQLLNNFGAYELGTKNIKVKLVA